MRILHLLSIDSVIVVVVDLPVVMFLEVLLVLPVLVVAVVVVHSHGHSGGGDDVDAHSYYIPDRGVADVHIFEESTHNCCCWHTNQN